ncbi:MAG: hypothetical protein HKN43_17125 [Rhodothermales bacterium]|nr:hypothetical protein [Rhodothermales bacterium]
MNSSLSVGACFLRRTLLFLMLVIFTGHVIPLSAREIPTREIVADEVDFALRDALIESDYDSFNRMLSLGADPTEWLDNSQYGWVMCAATEVGRERFLKLLIEKGYDINFRQSDISTAISLPLTCAVRFRNLNALEMLINSGADPTVKPCDDCSSRSPMSVMSEAILVGKYELAVWLFDKATYSQEQLATDISMLETQKVDESAAGNFYRLMLADLFREKGYEVTPWTRKKPATKLLPFCKTRPGNGPAYRIPGSFAFPKNVRFHTSHQRNSSTSLC